MDIECNDIMFRLVIKHLESMRKITEREQDTYTQTTNPHTE